MVRALAVFSLIFSINSAVAGDRPAGTWVPLTRTNLNFAAKTYQPGAATAAARDLPGLFKGFMPTTPNDKSLTITQVTFDPKSSRLTINARKKTVLGSLSESYSGKFTSNPWSGCGPQKTGFELKYASEHSLLTSVALRLCPTENADGSLSLFVQTGLVAGTGYKNWAEGTFRDIFDSLIKKLVAHLNSTSTTMRSKSTLLALPHALDSLSPQCERCRL
jgi:hypothetical protein